MGKKADGKKADGKKANAEKIAREAGKAAARAENLASEAVSAATKATGMLFSFLGRPAEVVAGGLGTALHAGQDAIGSVGAGVGKLLGSGGDEDVETVEARLRAVLAEMGVPTRSDLEYLHTRLNDLEKRLDEAKARKRGAATRARPASKTASKPPAAKQAKAPVKAAGRKAPAARAAKPAAPAEAPDGGTAPAE